MSEQYYNNLTPESQEIVVQKITQKTHASIEIVRKVLAELNPMLEYKNEHLILYRIVLRRIQQQVAKYL